MTQHRIYNYPCRALRAVCGLACIDWKRQEVCEGSARQEVVRKSKGRGNDISLAWPAKDYPKFNLSVA
jgi:hypothetical protein